MKDTLRFTLFGESKEEYVERMCEEHTAQEIHDMIMEHTGGQPGTSPGYSKKTMAKILYEVHSW